jgi:hypothetical protein
MSRDAKVSLEWADGEYDFKLGIGELRELQEKTRRIKNNKGEWEYVSPMKLFYRLSNDEWLVDDVREPIRIGLVGAGINPVEASRLVKRYVDEVPDWTLNCTVAANIVAAAVIGVEIEPLGKREGAKNKTEPTSDSSSLHSTPMQQ